MTPCTTANIRNPSKFEFTKEYLRDGYYIRETDGIRIGFSNVYIFYREEFELVKNQPQMNPIDACYARLVISVSAEGAFMELDAAEIPFDYQALDLIQLFKKFIFTAK